MRTVITIEARIGSTRLPGKVLLPILGRPMLARMVERLQMVRRADAIVVATTDHPADDPIAELAAALGVGCHRGSEDDVLARVLGAAEGAAADLIVETTGDCPLIDPSIVDQVIETFQVNQVDYCANVLVPSYPRGLDVQVFPTRVLAEVARKTTDPADREHVSLYIYEHPREYRLLNLASGHSPEVAELRWTVDTPEDYQLVTAIYQALFPSNPRFGWLDVLRLMELHPDLKTINQQIRQKAVR